MYSSQKCISKRPPLQLGVSKTKRPPFSNSDSKSMERVKCDQENGGRAVPSLGGLVYFPHIGNKPVLIVALKMGRGCACEKPINTSADKEYRREHYTSVLKTYSTNDQVNG